MKINVLTTADIEKIQVGKTELYDMPNRAACESGKANIYRWQMMQEPVRAFTCSVRDNHILLVTRNK